MTAFTPASFGTGTGTGPAPPSTVTGIVDPLRIGGEADDGRGYGTIVIVTSSSSIVPGGTGPTMSSVSSATMTSTASHTPVKEVPFTTESFRWIVFPSTDQRTVATGLTFLYFGSWIIDVSTLNGTV